MPQGLFLAGCARRYHDNYHPSSSTFGTAKVECIRWWMKWLWHSGCIPNVMHWDVRSAAEFSNRASKAAGVFLLGGDHQDELANNHPKIGDVPKRIVSHKRPLRSLFCFHPTSFLWENLQFAHVSAPTYWKWSFLRAFFGSLVASLAASYIWKFCFCSPRSCWCHICLFIANRCRRHYK